MTVVISCTIKCGAISHILMEIAYGNDMQMRLCMLKKRYIAYFQGESPRCLRADCFDSSVSNDRETFSDKNLKANFFINEIQMGCLTKVK